MAQAPPEASASSQITWAGGESGDNSSKTSFEGDKTNNHHRSSDPGLTVTFKDVGIEVHGQGEDYGATVGSVVRSLIPSFGKSHKSARVSLTSKPFSYN